MVEAVEQHRADRRSRLTRLGVASTAHASTARLPPVVRGGSEGKEVAQRRQLGLHRGVEDCRAAIGVAHAHELLVLGRGHREHRQLHARILPRRGGRPVHRQPPRWQVAAPARRQLALSVRVTSLGARARARASGHAEVGLDLRRCQQVCLACHHAQRAQVATAVGWAAASVAHQRVAQRGRQQREHAVLSLHARVIRETTQTESASPTTRVIAAARAWLSSCSPGTCVPKAER